MLVISINPGIIELLFSNIKSSPLQYLIVSSQIKRLFLRESIDGAVVLGIIEKGETEHGSIMGQSVIKSLIDLQLASMKPIGFGIIGPGAKPEHIKDRLLPYAKNSVLAVNEMLSN